ncbi:hypothetical protein, partial [Hungatella effluvii]|uniref:hypothetical protein n=1 Tax=Hungatella effluvii TaxID=1096246 RepID=UPI002A82EF99
MREVFFSGRFRKDFETAVKCGCISIYFKAVRVIFPLAAFRVFYFIFGLKITDPRYPKISA